MAFYENRQPESPGKGLVPVHMPLSQPRQDALTANVCTVIGKQEPIMLCDLEDTDLASRRQKLLHKAWDYAGIDVQLRKASTDATNFNKCIYKVTPASGEPKGMTGSPNASLQPGVDIAVIPPENVSVYPAALGGMQVASLVGDKLYKRLKNIRAGIGSQYYDVTVVSDNADSEDELGVQQHAGSALGLLPPDRDQELIEVWDCVVRLDLKEYGGPEGERKYRATLAFGNQELLALEPYPEEYRYTWYFEGFYIASGRTYWSSTSVARNLKPLQDQYNKLWSMFYTSGMAAAKPVVVGPKLEGGEKYTKWEHSDYIETDEPVQPWSPQIRTELGPITAAIEMVERNADQVARVSQNSLGAENIGVDTATENSIIASGVAVGIEEYIANFSSPLAAMAEHTEDVLLGMFDEIAPYYSHTVDMPVTDPMTGEPVIDPATGQPVMQPQQAPLVSPEEMQILTCWRPNGNSPSSTPQAKLQAAQMLVQAAADPAFGFDKYAIATVIYKNSPLAGDGNLQYSKEEMQRMALEAQQAQQEQMMMQAQMQSMQQGAQMDHEKGLQAQKQEADIERERERARPKSADETIGALVDIFGEDGLRQLLALAGGGGGQGMPQDVPPI